MSGAPPENRVFADFPLRDPVRLTDHNLVVDVTDVLKTVRAEHFAAIDPDELPQLLSILERNEAPMVVPTRIALLLMLLIFVCTSELIEAPWSKITLERVNSSFRGSD